MSVIFLYSNQLLMDKIINFSLLDSWKDD